jgi:putative SOS response-associated peptidase YedK
MCGRTTLVTPRDELREFFGLDELPELSPRYNIAPTQPIAIIREPRRLELVRWGLLLPKRTGINARVETIARAPAYRESFRKRRCLVVVDGFFEWQRQGKTSQPFRVERRDHRPYAMAGIWEQFVTKDGEILDACAIITGPAAGAVVPLHDRMPLVVAPEDYARWLDRELRDVDQVMKLITVDARELVTYPVSPRVNSPDNDDPGCLERYDPRQGVLF